MRAEPQDAWNTKAEPAEWATDDASSVNSGVGAVARFARLILLTVVDLGWSEVLGAEPQDRGYGVAARGVGDSRFIISELRRWRCRTLRALDSC